MDIAITNLQSAIGVPTSKVHVLVREATRFLKLKFPEMSIVFVAPQRMRMINNQFLGHDYVTDVITFTHGEIIICPSVAKKNAKIFNSSFEHELLLYVVHGLLHLAGYDDHHDNDIKQMRLMEARLMSKFIARKERTTA